MKNTDKTGVFMNSGKTILILLFAVSFLIFSCGDKGEVGNADRTDTYYSGNEVFNELLSFLDGVWCSRDPKIGLLNSYRIRKWSELTATDKTKAQALFPSLDIDNPITCSTKDTPKSSDYVLLFDDTVYGQGNSDSGNNENWGFCYMGIIRAINIFNDNKNRGAIIIEYFMGSDPAWSSDQVHGEKPFYGIFFKTLSQDNIQLANPIDLAAMYAGKPYYTEKGTLQEAVGFFNVENEAEFISWGVVIPQNREK
jgi:hypothetical protein